MAPKSNEELLKEARARIEGSPAVNRADERLARGRAAVATERATMARLTEEAAQNPELAGGGVGAILDGRQQVPKRDLQVQMSEASERLAIAQRAVKIAEPEASHARALASVAVSRDPRIQKPFTDLGRRGCLAVIALGEFIMERHALFNAAEAAGIALASMPNVPNPEVYLGHPLAGDGRLRACVEDGLRAGQITKADLPKLWPWALALADRIERERLAPPAA
jgi:hypothetical protein